MRKRFHIERQVERLANSRTLEVIEGVLSKLSNPPPILEEMRKAERVPTWYCNCLYCRIHLAYTYANIRTHKAEKQGSRRIADEHWSNIYPLKMLKEQLEALPLDYMAKKHIQEAKIYIGKEINSLKQYAMTEYNNIEDLKRSTQCFIDNHRFNLVRHHRTQLISWF